MSELERLIRELARTRPAEVFTFLPSDLVNIFDEKDRNRNNLSTPSLGRSQLDYAFETASLLREIDKYLDME